jgi:hypothetical protein
VICILLTLEIKLIYFYSELSNIWMVNTQGLTLVLVLILVKIDVYLKACRTAESGKYDGVYPDVDIDEGSAVALQGPAIEI